MKRFLISICSASLLIGMLAGCSESPTIVESEMNTETPSDNTDFITAETAHEIATEAVKKNTGADEWSTDSRVVAVDPIFIDGIESTGDAGNVDSDSKTHSKVSGRMLAGAAILGVSIVAIGVFAK